MNRVTALFQTPLLLWVFCLSVGFTPQGSHSAQDSKWSSKKSRANTITPRPADDAKEEPDTETREVFTRKKQATTYTVSPMSPGSHNASLNIGQVFLVGTLSDDFENALGTEANYTYGVSDLFGFEGNVGYSSHNGSVSGAQKLSLFHANAGIRTNLVYFDQLVPYLAAGLGFYNVSIRRASYELDGLLFGLHVGAGTELFLNDRFFFGARLMYQNMFSSSKADSLGTNRELGGAFISFLVRAGLSF